MSKFKAWVEDLWAALPAMVFFALLLATSHHMRVG